MEMASCPALVGALLTGGRPRPSLSAVQSETPPFSSSYRDANPAGALTPPHLSPVPFQRPHLHTQPRWGIRASGHEPGGRWGGRVPTPSPQQSAPGGACWFQAHSLAAYSVPASQGATADASQREMWGRDGRSVVAARASSHEGFLDARRPVRPPVCTAPPCTPRVSLCWSHLTNRAFTQNPDRSCAQHTPLMNAWGREWKNKWKKSPSKPCPCSWTPCCMCGPHAMALKRPSWFHHCLPEK